MSQLAPLAIENIEQRSDLWPAWSALVSRFLLHGLIVSTWVSCIPAVQSSLKLTNARLGLCLLGTAIGSVLAIPLTGWLVTRYGSKSVTAWSTLGFSLALIAPSLAGNAGLLFAALILFGAMAGANDVAINAQGIAVEQAMKKPTMSRFHAMFSIGGMIGASIGALVAAHGVAPQLHIAVACALFIVISVVTAPFLFDAQDNLRSHSRPLRLRSVPITLVTLAAIGFCMFLSEGAIADWTGVYLKQGLNASAGLAAAGYAVFSTGMALFRLLGDSLTARLGPVRMVRTGALLAAAGLLLALTAKSATGALPGFALAGAGFSVIVPLVFGAGGRIGSVASGAGVAIVSGSGYIGFLFGPPLIGLVAQHSSLRFAMFIIVGLSLLAAALANAVRGAAADESVTVL
jgi:MFS family permease